MGDANGNPSPQASPSPVLDFLKSVGSTALAVPKAVGGAVGDIAVGEHGDIQLWQEQLKRILATALVGENLGAQLSMRNDWDNKDALYRTAPDTLSYRSIAEQGGQPALDRYYGAGKVPPLSSIPHGEGTGLSPDVRPTGIQWGGPTLEEQQHQQKAIEISDFMAKLEASGGRRGYGYTSAIDSKGNVTGKMQTLQGKDSLYDYDRVKDDPALARLGLQAIPTEIIDRDGTRLGYLQTDPGLQAYLSSRGSASGKFDSENSVPGSIFGAPPPAPIIPGQPPPAPRKAEAAPMIEDLRPILKDGVIYDPVSKGVLTIGPNGHYYDTDGNMVLFPGEEQSAPGTLKPTPGTVKADKEPYPTPENMPGASRAEISAAQKQWEAREAAATKTGATEDVSKEKLDRIAASAQAQLDVMIDRLDALTTEKALPLADNPPSTFLGGLQDLGYQAKQAMRGQATNAFPEQAALMEASEGLLGQIARRVSGEKGVLTESDVTRARGLIVSSKDSLPRGKWKIAELRKFTHELTDRYRDANWKPSSPRVKMTESVDNEGKTTIHFERVEAGGPDGGLGAEPAPTGGDIPLEGGFSIRLKGQ